MLREGNSTVPSLFMDTFVIQRSIVFFYINNGVAEAVDTR